MKKIIVFGATGNVGSYFLEYAADYFDNDNYEIIASGRRKTDFFERKNIKYYSVDITNAGDFDVLPKDNVYAVVHLAAAIPSYMEKYNASQYINSIIVGTYNVLEYCRKVKADRILYTTTVFDLSLKASQDSQLLPDQEKSFSYTGDHAMYVICKNTCIEFLEHYFQQYNLKKFIFRLPTIYNYSPNFYYYHNGQKTMRPVYQMINKAIASEDIELWGDPEYSKDMVHVNDFSQMVCKAIECNRNSGLYNVGTGQPVTLREEIETIVKVFSPEDNPSKIIYRPDKEASGGFIMNIDNAISELGYKPEYNCLKLFQDFKQEMQINRFKELREEK